jgi:hypothetical protein
MQSSIAHCDTAVVDFELELLAKTHGAVD